jgi:uncharacterized membrane protein HdeD (DUF308 family)
VADPAPGDVVRVEVKSAWTSKINWTQAVAGVAMLLAYFGINLDANTQAAILALIVALQSITTWVLKTWFTNTVTAAAVTKPLRTL